MNIDFIGGEPTDHLSYCKLWRFKLIVIYGKDYIGLVIIDT